VHIPVLLLLCIPFSKPLVGGAQANRAAAHDRLTVCRQSDVDGSDSTAEALLFVRGLLVEGRATAEPQATVKVLRHLAQDPHPASEDSFVAVLQTATLQGLQSLPSLLLLLSLVFATQRLQTQQTSVISCCQSMIQLLISQLYNWMQVCWCHLF